MLRLTLAQMRRSLPRLVAAAIAIAISTAFVAASFLAGDAIQRATFDQVAARYASADLLVFRQDGEGLTVDDIAAIADTPGVSEATGLMTNWFGFRASNRSIWIQTLPSAPEVLLPVTLGDGTWPVGASEVALSAPLAERLDVAVGGTVDLESWDFVRQTSAFEPLTVTGLLDDPNGAFTATGGVAVMDSAPMLERLGSEVEGARIGWFSEASLTVEPGASLAAVTASLEAAFSADGLRVTTPHERASAIVATQTGGVDVMFLVFVLTFAAVALLVAGLVIANTFQVLVAQRTQTLATLRAVGASKRQVGGTVVLEALILAVTASLLGVALGIGLVQATLSILRGGDGAAASLPAVVHVTPRAVIVPIVAGVAVTLLAAHMPVRLASRVAPLAAMRPEPGVSLDKGTAGLARLVLSILATVIGFALLGLGVFLGLNTGEATIGLLAGLAGGALSFVGITISAVFWMPHVTALAGRLVGLTSPIARLASANTLRNPRRTVATATALLIGVTLVTMMSTGAATARNSLNAQLDAHFPTDMVLESVVFTTDDTGRWQEPIPADLIGAISAEPGVAAATALTASVLTLTDLDVLPDEESRDRDFLLALQVLAVDPTSARPTLSDPALLDGLVDGTILLPSVLREQWGTDLPTINVFGSFPVDGTPPTDFITLRPVFSEDRGLRQPVMTLTDFAALGEPTAPTQMWLSLDNLGAVGTVQDLVADSGASIAVEGNALERAQFDTIIDTILAIVVGLLAVAVVIALIGVANTLSLSVIERRRESATLRAIGVTRGQLRGMLALEGVLIAAVGVVLGIALGLLYGWAGSLTLLGALGRVELAVPGREILLTCAIALAAGLLASILPGRSAANEPPVAALAAA